MRPIQRHFSISVILAGPLPAGFFALIVLAAGMAAWPAPKSREAGGGEGAGKEDWPSLRTEVSVVSQGSLSSTIRLRGGEGLSVLGLDIDGDGATLRAALCLGPLIAGPGFLAGPAGFLSSPVALSATSLGGAPFRIDTGLASGLSLLALDLGPATVFALCRNGSRGCLAAARGLAAPGASSVEAGFLLPSQPIPGDAGCGTGIVARIEAGGGDLAFITAASRSGPSGSSESWRLDAAPDPGGFGLVSGLAYEAKGQGWRSAFGLEYSWGPLRGGGPAARFEGSAFLGPLRFSVMAGYAAPRFRDCLGEGEARGAALALGCSLPLWRGASFRASCRTECPSFLSAWPSGGALCGLLEGSASLAFSSSLGGTKAGSGAMHVRSGLSFGRDDGGKAFLVPDLGFSGRTGMSAWNAGISGRWTEASDGPGAEPSIKAAFRAATPSSAPLSLVAGCSVSWKQGSGPSLDADMGLGSAVFGGGRISVLVEWRKLGLGILDAGTSGPAPVAVFRYSMSQ